MATTTPAPAAASVAVATPSLWSRLIAEAVGTFFLVVAVLGTALFFAASQGPFSVAIAIGLVVLVGAYAFGPISGGHFNPAVTLGVAAAGRFAWVDVVPYVAAQVVGGILGSSAIALISAFGPSSNNLSTNFAAGFASNGYDTHSPAGYGLVAALVAEIVLTALFLYVILSVTHVRAAAGFAPLAIGFTLTIIHLIAIPIDNASVNPARSIAAAIWGGVVPLEQLWVFIVAPIVGALIAGFTFKFLFDRRPVVDATFLAPLDLTGQPEVAPAKAAAAPAKAAAAPAKAPAARRAPAKKPAE